MVARWLINMWKKQGKKGIPTSTRERGFLVRVTPGRSVRQVRSAIDDDVLDMMEDIENERIERENAAAAAATTTSASTKNNNNTTAPVQEEPKKKKPEPKKKETTVRAAKATKKTEKPAPKKQPKAQPKKAAKK